MDIRIVQKKLFEIVSEATLIDISEDEGFEKLNSFLEAIHTHINFLDTDVSAYARSVIDTNWEKYKEGVQSQVPQHEYGDNPKQLERDRTKTIYNLRLQFKDTTLSQISELINDSGVM